MYTYTPENLFNFLACVDFLPFPCKVSKRRSSHTAHITVPFARLEQMKRFAGMFDLEFSVGKFYHRGTASNCQIVVKAG